MNVDLLNEEYIDIFKEIANIGSSHATAALASMLKNKLRMQVPDIKIVKVEDISALLGDEEKVVVSTLLTMSGDINGLMMNIFEVDTTLKIINTILKKNLTDISQLDNYEYSFLKEMGNILTSSYISAMGTLTNLKITPSIPSLSVDMAGAILSVPAIQYGIMSDDVLLIDTQFYSDTEVLRGYYLMVPDEISFIKMLTSLGVKFSG